MNNKKLNPNALKYNQSLFKKESNTVYSTNWDRLVNADKVKSNIFHNEGTFGFYMITDQGEIPFYHANEDEALKIGYDLFLPYTSEPMYKGITVKVYNEQSF